MFIYFMAIWNILWRFWYITYVFIWCIFPGLVSCTKKNLATLVVVLTIEIKV
jgi:hypothetical protein